MRFNKDYDIELPSTRSLFSFLWMPEIKRSFPAFAHIKPILIRTIAIMFAQSGLLQPNHPATMYGLVKGMPRVKFADLIGEIWYNLRTGDGASPYHYGLFFGVILMICLTIAGFFVFVANIAVGTASAQLFNHPAIADTSFSGVAAQSGGTMFDTGAGGSPDLALGIFDRVFRQPVLGNGGALQNAFGPLMNTYNTAVLLIASIIVFWAILSVIIDTARTGQLGGGRHSMVWVPIRFVFSLGLMIPMASGFNSGQLILMKVAEWGSNLGTNGWVNYVAAASSKDFLAEYASGQAVNLANSLARVEICRDGYNSLLTAGGTSMASNYRITEDVTGWGISRENNTFVGNVQDKALCGVITHPNPNGNIADKIADANANPGFFAFPVAALNAIFVTFGASSTNTEVTKYQKALRTAHYDALMVMQADLQSFSCGFVADHLVLPVGALTCTVPNAGGCGGDNDPQTGNVVQNIDCIDQVALDYRNAIIAAHAANLAAVQGFIAGGGFLAEVQAAGWGGMGIWYHKISQLNAGIAEALADRPKVTQGKMEALAGQSEQKSLFQSKSYKPSMIKTKDLMQDFDKWWLNTVGTGGVNTETKTESSDANTGGVAPTDAEGAMNWFITKILLETMLGEGNGYFFFEISSTNSNTYPLAELTRIGDSIIQKSLAMFAAILGISMVGGVLGSNIIGDLLGLDGLMNAVLGPVGDLFGAIAFAGLGFGLVLKYYVPLIPWIRVTFAVMAWIVTILEAIVIIPLLCLSNLSTEGDGLFTAQGKNIYMLLLGVLLRPILTVIGYVAALLIFNAMVIYVNNSITQTMASIAGNTGAGAFGQIAYTVIYVFVIYTLANSCFKLVDTVPNSIAKYLGGAAADNEQSDSSVEGWIAGGAHMAQGAGGKLGGAGQALGNRMGGGKRKEPSTES